LNNENDTAWVKFETYNMYQCFDKVINYNLSEELYDHKKSREENIEQAKYEIIKDALRDDSQEARFIYAPYIPINFK
jgi:hypothetical protein